MTFPLFAKVKTVGEGQSPVYRYLAADHGEPKWNFHKYLVSKKGRVIKAFPTSVAPDDPKLRAAIEAALATLKRVLRRERQDEVAENAVGALERDDEHAAGLDAQHFSFGGALADVGDVKLEGGAC